MTPLVDKAKKHCIDLLNRSRCKKFPFHNAQHTLEVCNNAIKIAAYEKVWNHDLEAVLLASLFHDTGMIKSIDCHEDFSMAEASSFLNGVEYENTNLRTVLDCINATRSEITPQTVLEAILCDADLFHLGMPYFLEKNELLRREWSQFLDKSFSDDEWVKLNIAFLRNHTYFTVYGREILDPVKFENINFLESLL